MTAEGELFYWNEATGESRWELPAGEHADTSPAKAGTVNAVTEAEAAAGVASARALVSIDRQER